MSSLMMFALFLIAVMLQGGTYGLTFMLPRLFDGFGADEKAVGAMLIVTIIATLLSVYYSGHLSDHLGRVGALSLACVSIAAALVLYGLATSVGVMLVAASILLGAGWGVTYALGPVVLTRLVTAEERVRYFALNSVFLMAGFGLSPVMAAEIEGAGSTLNDAFLITAGFCLISAALFFLLIGPVRANAVNPVPEATSRMSLTVVRDIF